jgi:hypothetical protein
MAKITGAKKSENMTGKINKARSEFTVEGGVIGTLLSVQCKIVSSRVGRNKKLSFAILCQIIACARHGYDNIGATKVLARSIPSSLACGAEFAA